MNKTFNGKKLYLLDIRTIYPFNNTIYYAGFGSHKFKKFDLKMFTNPIAITGLYKKQYLVYSLNDQMQVFELGSLAAEKIEPKTSPNTFIAKFKDFYVSTSKLELIELYKKHCRKAKAKVDLEVEKISPFHRRDAFSYYDGLMGKIDETYRDFLKQIKEL
jgi:hypothetical protein